MKKIILFLFILSLSGCYESVAQTRPFSEWESTAFCNYTRYHPFKYIQADNNWEIMQALRMPNTRQYLDSVGIKNTLSQLMLLRIEGFISKEKDDKWVTTMPLLDSLQTVDARRFSRRIAEELYPKIKTNCSDLVDYLTDKGLSESAFTVLFSYILDGRVWKLLGSYEDIKSSATWEGECWALYFPRKLNCGTNTYSDCFSVCRSDEEPDFIGKELKVEAFIKPLIEDYNKYGKIIDPNILSKAYELGIVNKEGLLLIPVIDDEDEKDYINVISDRITGTISCYFTQTDIVSAFWEKFGIGNSREKLASTMLYHEVMWDLIDQLLEDEIISYPLVWKDKNANSIYSIVILKK